MVWGLESGEISAHEAQNFSDQLSDQQIADVAAYVAEVAGGDVGRFDIGRTLDESPWSALVLALAALIAIASVAFAIRVMGEIRTKGPQPR